MRGTQFFGERWDAPRVDDATQVLTPVGRSCAHCCEPICEGDRGLIIGCVRMHDGQPTASLEPVHMECDLRFSIGNIAHLQGRCRCHHTESAQEEVAATFRQEGHETLAWVNAQRARRGVGPM